MKQTFELYLKYKRNNIKNNIVLTILKCSKNFNKLIAEFFNP